AGIGLVVTTLGPSRGGAAASRSPGRAAAVEPRRRTSRVRRSTGAAPATASSGKRASCRASVRPIRARRARLRTLRKSRNTARVRSEPPGRMERRDAPGQTSVARLLQPGGGDLAQERALRRKAPDAFGEIGVSIRVAGDDPAEHGQHLKTV